MSKLLERFIRDPKSDIRSAYFEMKEEEDPEKKDKENTDDSELTTENLKVLSRIYPNKTISEFFKKSSFYKRVAEEEMSDGGDSEKDKEKDKKGSKDKPEDDAELTTENLKKLIKLYPNKKIHEFFKKPSFYKRVAEETTLPDSNADGEDKRTVVDHDRDLSLSVIPETLKDGMVVVDNTMVKYVISKFDVTNVYLVNKNTGDEITVSHDELRSNYKLSKLSESRSISERKFTRHTAGSTGWL